MEFLLFYLNNCMVCIFKCCVYHFEFIMSHIAYLRFNLACYLKRRIFKRPIAVLQNNNNAHKFYEIFNVHNKTSFSVFGCDIFKLLKLTEKQIAPVRYPPHTHLESDIYNIKFFKKKIK